HRAHLPEQGELLVDVSGDRSPTDAPEDRGLVRGGDDVDGELSAGAAAKPAKSAKKKSAKAPAEPGSIAARALANGGEPVKNLPPLDSPEMKPLRALLEDPSVKKTGQNAKYDLLVLRRSGVNLR